MITQKRQEVLDLYRFLGLEDVSSVNTTLSQGNINGDVLQDAVSEENNCESQEAIISMPYNN